MTLGNALLSLITRPVDLLVRRWNWKAALFSSLIRGIIFLLANLTSGWRAAVGAMLAEWCYRALTSGFYGAMTQTLGEAEPEWQGAAAAMVLLPISSHSLEFLVHWLRHTPHLKASIISSMSFTVVSTLFNFYAMRRGTMVVGRNAPSIGDDMRAMPRVIGGFLSVLPLCAWRSLRGVTAIGKSLRKPSCKSLKTNVAHSLLSAASTLVSTPLRNLAKGFWPSKIQPRSGDHDLRELPRRAQASERGATTVGNSSRGPPRVARPLCAIFLEAQGPPDAARNTGGTRPSSRGPATMTCAIFLEAAKREDDPLHELLACIGGRHRNIL